MSTLLRYLDELSLMEVPEPNSLSSPGGLLLLQQLAPVREALLQPERAAGGEVYWATTAAEMTSNVFYMTDATDPDLIKLADIYSDDLANAV